MNLHLGSLQKLPIDIDKIIVSILSLFVTPCLHALIIIYVYADWSIISIIMLDIAKSLDYSKQMGNKLRVLRGTVSCAAVGNNIAAFQCLIFAEAKKQHYLMIFTSAWSLGVMEYFSHSSLASSVGEDAVQPRGSGLAVSAENYVTFQQLWLIFEVTKVTIRTQFHSQSVA